MVTISQVLLLCVQIPLTNVIEELWWKRFPWTYFH